MEELIIASNNAHKIKEIKAILGNFFPRIVSMREAGLDIEIEETGSTFKENALIKARTVSEITGKPCLADDSGLSVDCLFGAPGVYSARFAGEGHNDEDNIRKLLKEMANADDRRAHFNTTICLYYPSGRYLTAEGKAYGRILTEKRGENGFGYDPVFFSDELNKTFAEAGEQEKNSVSHRAKALLNLENMLK